MAKPEFESRLSNPKAMLYTWKMEINLLYFEAPTAAMHIRTKARKDTSAINLPSGEITTGPK